MAACWMTWNAALIAACTLLGGCERVRPSADAGDASLQRVSGSNGTAPAGDARSAPDGLRAAAAGNAADDIAAAAEAAVDRWQAELRAAVREHVAVLAAGNDGRGKAVAAVLGPIFDESMLDAEAAQRERDRLLGEAARLAPDDPLLARLEALHCTPTAQTCSRADGYARWQRLDPDNSAAWLAPLHDAIASGDTAQVESLLVRAAAASHHNVGIGEIALLLDETLAQVALPPRDSVVDRGLSRELGLPSRMNDADLRAASVGSITVAVALPVFLPLMSTCRGAGGVTAANCSAVFQQLATADTVLERGVGLTGMRRLTEGTAAEAHWREQQRRNDWRIHAGARAGFDARDLRRSWTIGEVAAIDERLARLGQTTPPPGWRARRPGT